MVQYGAFPGLHIDAPLPDQAMPHEPLPTGTLHVVSTPIGNLEDITLRALRVLREAAVIAAEDTRRTARLLAHFSIATPTLSLHEHNEQARVPQLLARLKAGQSIALVTDAGTPLLSDPGQALVRAAIDSGVRIEPIPGPSAVLTALVAAGIDAHEFAFLGFPPNKQAARRVWYERADDLQLPFVAFEAPHRLVASLHDAAETLGHDRPAVACRELTKLHEEYVRGDISALISHFGTLDPRGELTLVFAAASRQEGSPAIDLSDESVWAELCQMTDSGIARRDATKRLARRLGRSSRDIYAAAERGKPTTRTP